MVTFLLGREIYGIDILKIQEVIHFQEVIRIPNAPEFVEGVTQVRDRVIPVVDLKRRLGILDASDSRHRIVILELDGQSLGVVVDDISMVLTLDASDYEVLPESVMDDRETACISRLAKADSGLIIVITPERILSRRERDVLKEFKKTGEQGQNNAGSSCRAV